MIRGHTFRSRGMVIFGPAARFAHGVCRRHTNSLQFWCVSFTYRKIHSSYILPFGRSREYAGHIFVCNCSFLRLGSVLTVETFCNLQLYRRVAYDMIQKPPEYTLGRTARAQPKGSYSIEFSIPPKESLSDFVWQLLIHLLSARHGTD